MCQKSCSEKGRPSGLPSIFPLRDSLDVVVSKKRICQLPAALYCPGEKPHLLDHLAPLGALLELPLYVDSEEMLRLARLYYPELQTRYLKDVGHLAQRYDCLVSSATFPHELKWVFESCYGKRMKFVYCPHGFSDKKVPLAHYSLHDLVFLYGALHRELLEELGLWTQMRAAAMMGNVRLAYYLQHVTRWEEALPKRGSRPLLLYAPTWRDPEQGTSAFDQGAQLLREIPDHWDVWVKLHPLLEERDLAATVALERWKGKAHFLPHGMPIYPLLARCDAFVGDASSINYDLLAFQKPMFFLSRPSERMAAAGFTLGSGSLFAQIEAQLGNVPRVAQAALYERAFGPLEPLTATRHRLQSSLDTLMAAGRSRSPSSPNRAPAIGP